MKVALRNREAMRRISPALENELDEIIQGIETAFHREHDEEGRHTRISAISIDQRVYNAQNVTPRANMGGSFDNQGNQILSVVSVPTFGASAAGLASSAAAGSVSLLAASVSLTESQFEALNTTPQTIIAGATGIIHVPFRFIGEVHIASNYANSPTFQLRYAGSSTDLVPTFNLAINSGATAGRRIGFSIPAGAANFYSDSGINPSGTALQVSASADPAVGSITGSAVFTVYYIRYAAVHM